MFYGICPSQKCLLLYSHSRRRQEIFNVWEERTILPFYICPKNSYKNPQTSLCTSSLHWPHLYISYFLDKRLMHVNKMLWILLPCLSTLVSLYTCQISTAVSTKTWLSGFCGNQSYYDNKSNCHQGQISLWKSATPKNSPHLCCWPGHSKGVVCLVLSLWNLLSHTTGI